MLTFYFNDFRFLFSVKKVDDVMIENYKKYIDNAVTQWDQRLQAFVLAERGHF